jgi:CheY-like chemotaxis protein
VTVLIIDDHSQCRRVTVDLLSNLGYRTLTAADAREAEELFRRHGDQIDVVVMDLFLGSTPGVTLARRLESQRAGLRVLFISGYDEEMCTTPDLLGPNRHFLAKPFSLTALGSALESLLG